MGTRGREQLKLCLSWALHFVAEAEAFAIEKRCKICLCRSSSLFPTPTLPIYQSLTFFAPPTLQLVLSLSLFLALLFCLSRSSNSRAIKVYPAAKKKCSCLAPPSLRLQLAPPRPASFWPGHCNLAGSLRPRHSILGAA